MSSRAAEFLNIFNDLHSYLREVAGDATMDFGAALRAAADKSAAVRAHKDELNRIRELRNVIVHDTRGQKEFIAEPTAETLDRLFRILSGLRKPRLALEMSGGKPEAFLASDRLDAALVHMGANDYSQIAVHQGEGYVGLTAEGITRWVASCIPDEFALTDTTLGDVLRHEKPGGVRFIPRTATVYDARDEFEREPAAGCERLLALFITHDGRPDQTPIGVVTPWDLLSTD